MMPSLGTPVAVVDCGTNSIRLLVKAGSVTLERRMVVTRLGRATDRTKRLDPEGVARTLEVLGEYRDLIEAHGARRSRATLKRRRGRAVDLGFAWNSGPSRTFRPTGPIRGPNGLACAPTRR